MSWPELTVRPFDDHLCNQPQRAVTDAIIFVSLMSVGLCVELTPTARLITSLHSPNSLSMPTDFHVTQTLNGTSTPSIQ